MTDKPFEKRLRLVESYQGPEDPEAQAAELLQARLVRLILAYHLGGPLEPGEPLMDAYCRALGADYAEKELKENRSVQDDLVRRHNAALRRLVQARRGRDLDDLDDHEVAALVAELLVEIPDEWFQRIGLPIRIDMTDTKA